jgi:hypothetical protein
MRQQVSAYITLESAIAGLLAAITASAFSENSLTSPPSNSPLPATGLLLCALGFLIALWSYRADKRLRLYWRSYAERAVEIEVQLGMRLFSKARDILESGQVMDHTIFHSIPWLAFMSAYLIGFAYFFTKIPQ